MRIWRERNIRIVVVAYKLQSKVACVKESGYIFNRLSTEAHNNKLHIYSRTSWTDFSMSKLLLWVFDNNLKLVT